MISSRIAIRAKKTKTDENKRNIHSLFGSRPLVKIIQEYAGFRDSEAWFSFFQDNSSREEILMLGRYAVSPKKVIAAVKKAHAKKEKWLPEIIIKGAVQAVRDGDVSLRSTKKEIIYQGMAETFMLLCLEFYPKQFPQCLDQVRLAAPVEDDKQFKNKKGLYQRKITALFDAIKRNDGNTHDAIEAFNNWVQPLPVVDRLLLLCLARLEFGKRGGELPPVNLEDSGSWGGVLGDLFCYGIMGDVLQKGMSSRIQQILRYGVFNLFGLFSDDKPELIRVEDLDASLFIGPRGSDRELGVTAFFDIYGRAGAETEDHGRSIFLYEVMFECLVEAIRTAYASYHHTQDLLSLTPPSLLSRCVIA